MSRQNKVNPGMYTQRGRLTQDDAARELARQRSIGSQHVWQHDSKNAMPWPTAKQVPSAAVPGAGDAEIEVTKPVKAATKKPAARKQLKTAAKTKKKIARTAPVKAKAARTAKPKAKAGRKAVLARNAAGPAAKPRRSAKRPKS